MGLPLTLGGRPLVSVSRSQETRGSAGLLLKKRVRFSGDVPVGVQGGGFVVGAGTLEQAVNRVVVACGAGAVLGPVRPSLRL